MRFQFLTNIKNGEKSDYNLRLYRYSEGGGESQIRPLIWFLLTPHTNLNDMVEEWVKIENIYVKKWIKSELT